MSDSCFEPHHEGGGQHGVGIHVRHEGRGEHGADLHERDERRQHERIELETDRPIVQAHIWGFVGGDVFCSGPTCAWTTEVTG